MNKVTFLRQSFNHFITQLQNHDKAWQKRKRKIGTLDVVFSIIASFEHRGSQRVVKALGEFSKNKQQQVALSSLRLGRSKMGWGFLRRILITLFCLHQEIYGNQSRWKGLRLFAIDGSNINMPMEFKSKKYKGNDKNAAYPMAQISLLYLIGPNLPANVEFCRHRDERRAAIHHLKKLQSQDLVLFDRGYLSYDFLEQVIKRDIQAIFRVSRSCFKALQCCWEENQDEDQDVMIDHKGFKANIRVIRCKLGSKTYLFATTLLDRKKYPRRTIIDLYRKRWNIEEGYKTIKKVYEVEKFSSRSTFGVKQEILIAIILSFLSRLMEVPKKSKNIHSKNNGKVTAALLLRFFSVISRDKNSVLKSDIHTLFQLGYEYRMYYEENRSFKRKSSLPPQKWRPPRKRYKPKERLERQGLAA